MNTAQRAESAFGDPADCGHPNPVWWVDSRLWNEVMGGDRDAEASGVVCPTCFARFADEYFANTVWRVTGWRLVPEFARRRCDGEES